MPKTLCNLAKKQAEGNRSSEINEEAYRIAKQMKRENQDVVGEKCIGDDTDNPTFDESKRRAWKEHYEQLLNVEFPWSKEDLSVAPS